MLIVSLLLHSERLFFGIFEGRNCLEGAFRGELLVTMAAVVGDILLLLVVFLLPLDGLVSRILDLLNVIYNVMEGGGLGHLLPFISSII